MVETIGFEAAGVATTRIGGLRCLILIAAAFASPAAAQGFNIAQLLGYGFEVRAAIAAGTGAKPAADVLYLQGRLPSDARDSVMRCIIHPSAGQDDANCQKVY